MRGLIVLVALIVGVVLGLRHLPDRYLAPLRPSVTVDRVVDGDTLVVRNESGGRETIRLAGVDTPETVDPGRRVGCFGPEASANLVRLAPAGAKVDVLRLGTDRYGRTLAYVRVSGTDLGLEQIAGGFGVANSFGDRNPRDVDYASAELEASNARRGLHGACAAAD